MTPRPFVMTLLTLLALFGAGGCINDKPTDPSAQPNPGDSPPAGTSATLPARPTLADVLGTGGTQAQYAQQVSATERERQELIKACMAKQGFRYVPYVAAGEIVNLTGLPTDLPDDEFRRRHGYGVSTGFEASLSLPPVSPTGSTDPNQAIVAAMSQSERAAYLRALNGQVASGGQAQGCQGEATATADRIGAVFETYGDPIREMNTRINADKRIVDAERAWSTCLERAGYRYVNEAAIRRELQHRMNPLYDAVAGRDVPDGTIILRAGHTLTAEQRALLASVKAFELALANADQDCRGDLDRVRKAVRDEYEAEFVAANRDGLRKLLPGAGL